MLLTPDHFVEAFEEIRRTSLTHSTCKLAVFVACLDVDAICASNMLCALLKKNLIVFQMIPVVGYNDIKSKYSKLDESISNVLMLGCGSMVDMESFLGIDVNDFLDREYYDSLPTPENSDQLDQENLRLTRKIYVIDGHRPWNLENLFGSRMIQCVDDGSSSEELKREKDAYEFLISVDDDEEEGGGVNNKEVEELAETSDEEEEGEVVEVLEEGEHEDTEQQSSQGSKRRLSESHGDAKRKKTRTSEYEQVVEEYYNQGTTITTSSALQMYTLLSTVGEPTANYLWLAIVGTTSLNADYSNVYEEIAPLLKDEVRRVEAKSEEYEKEFGRASQAQKEGSLDADVGNKADNKGLQLDKEYSLFLLRHWNMYDAFFYSNYVSSKLQLYTTEGRKKLKTMFARMGISLASASQHWHYLDLDLKRRINKIFEKNLAQLGLTDVIRDGFVRNFGFKGSISAGDYVEAITALLEFDGDVGPTAKEAEHGVQSSTPPPSSQPDEPEEQQDGGDRLTKLIAQREAQFIRNFWKAYDALSNYDMVMKGISIAQMQQKFIFEKGFEIFQKRMIRNLRIFRLVVLKDSFTSNNTITDLRVNNYAPSRHNAGGIGGSSAGSSSSALNERDRIDMHTLGASQKLFQNPLLLTKLGSWLLEACVEMDGTPLPMVIASLDPDTGTYLVCGLPPKQRNMRGMDTELDAQLENDKSTALNTFSLAFQEIATSTGAQARIDSFESSIIELRKEDLAPFLEKLTLSGIV